MPGSVQASAAWCRGGPADLRDEFWQAYQLCRAHAGISIRKLGIETDPCAIKWALLTNSRLIVSGFKSETCSEHVSILLQHIDMGYMNSMDTMYSDCKGRLAELVSLRCEKVDSLLKGGALIEGVFGALVTLTKGQGGSSTILRLSSGDDHAGRG